MSHTPPPTIRVIDQGMNVRFPPQKHWGFVSAERFELRLDAEVSMSELRHNHAHLSDVSLSISMKDLERLIQSRLERSSFKEIHFLGAASKTSGQPSPLMCWGVFQPHGQRPQTFYLEGGFHALAHSLRFEFYQGILFGLGELNAQTLAALLLKETGLPAQRTHPTVLNIDPLTEVSIAYCLDWGWKLPKRKLASEIDISAKEISFISGRTRDAYLQSSFDPTANKITPQQKVHLDYLRQFHEGEGLIHAEELESAKIFFKSHVNEPRAAARFFDLSRYLGEANEHLNEWIKESNLSPIETERAKALIAESTDQNKQAAYHWQYFIELELEGFRESSISKPSERSPLSLTVLEGLKEYTIGLLLSNLDHAQSLAHLESARSKLGLSCELLNVIAQVAAQTGDLILAQARLTEAAQYLASHNQSSQAALTWIKVGELWMDQEEHYDNAERAMRRALDIDPTALDAYFKLVQLNELRGDFIAAKALLERILELSPYSKLARDTLNRIALELEQPLEDRPKQILNSKQVAVTIIPQETDERLAPVKSAAPLPQNHKTPVHNYISDAQSTPEPSKAKQELPTPPPKPLSAGPFAQQDPWSLAPQEKLESWLNQSVGQTGLDTHFEAQGTTQDQKKPLLESTSPESTPSSEKITSSPQALNSNERATEKPKRQERPTLEPALHFENNETQQFNEQTAASNRSERITLPPLNILETSSRFEEQDHQKKLPLPPRANQTPITWHTGDFDAINTALSIAHPQQDSEPELPIVETPIYKKNHESETKSPQAIASPKLDQHSDQTQKVEFSSELEKKRQSMEAALEDLLSSEEAENEIAQLQTNLQQSNDPQQQAEQALAIANIYRDQVLDLTSAKNWLWKGLQYSPDEMTLHELKESLAELYTITQDWEGLLSYYHFIAKQEEEDPAEAYLQRASLLKTLGRQSEALVDCEQSLILLKKENRRKQSAQRQDRYEEVIRLKADLLSLKGESENAVHELLHDHELLDLTRVALRKAYAARLLHENNPEQANGLFQEAYEANQSESLLEEWLGFTQQWGDPYAKASVVRAMVQGEQESSDSEADNDRVSARRLAQLADEVAEDTPLLALELYQESLNIQLDLDIVERLITIAEAKDQYYSLLNGLNLLIPQCFEGEYRGILKLKRAFIYYILNDGQAAEEAQEALVDFEGKIESLNEFEELLAWAETRILNQDYHQVLTWLDSVGIFDH